MNGSHNSSFQERQKSRESKESESDFMLEKSVKNTRRQKDRNIIETVWKLAKRSYRIPFEEDWKLKKDTTSEKKTENIFWKVSNNLGNAERRWKNLKGLKR